MGAGPGKQSLPQPIKGLPPKFTSHGINFWTLLPDECASLPDEEDLISIHSSDFLGDSDAEGTFISDKPQSPRPPSPKNQFSKGGKSTRGKRVKGGKSTLGRGASMPHSSSALSKVDDVPELVTETLALCAPPVTLLPERQSQLPSGQKYIPVHNSVPDSVPTLSHSDKHISPDIATSSTPLSKPTQPPQVTFAQPLSQIIQTISNQQPTSTLVQPPSNLFGISKARVHRPLPKNSKLKVHIHATFADGTTKQLQALVDTGA